MLYCRCYRYAAEVAGQLHEPPAAKSDEMTNEMTDDMIGEEDEAGEDEQAEDSRWDDWHEDEMMEDDEMEEWYNKSMLACQFVWRVAGDVLCQVRAIHSGSWAIADDNCLKQTVLGTAGSEAAAVKAP